MVKDVNEGWLSAGRKPPGSKRPSTSGRPQQNGARGKPKPPGKRPGTKAPAGKTNVTSHSRTVETRRGLFGRRTREVPVKRHTRPVNGSSRPASKGPGKKKSYKRRAKAAVSPKAARKNLVRAWRKNKRGKNGQAIGLASLGAVQLVLWLAGQTFLLAIAGGAMLLAAVALVIDEVTDNA